MYYNVRNVQIAIVMHLVWEHYKNAKNVAVIVLVMVLAVVVRFVEVRSLNPSDSPDLIYRKY